MRALVALVVVAGALAAIVALGARASPPPAATPASNDSLDTRTPLPLLPEMAAHQRANMRDHLMAVQEIAAALAVADYDGVVSATKRIGFSDAMAQQCTHMGAGAPGFTERALDFHKTADTIAVAASHKNPEETLRALSTTLARCTSCHATYKQQIVDEATWRKLTGTAPPVHAAH